MTYRTAKAHHASLIEALTPITKDVALQDFEHVPEAKDARRALGRGFWFTSEGHEHITPYTAGTNRRVAFVVLNLFYPAAGNADELDSIIEEDHGSISRALIEDDGPSATTTIIGVGDLHTENQSLLPSTHVDVDGGTEVQIRYPMFHID